jgi:hypothetical protein
LTISGQNGQTGAKYVSVSGFVAGGGSPRGALGTESSNAGTPGAGGAGATPTGVGAEGGGGGGGGAYAEGQTQTSPNAVFTVTIGAAGAAGTAATVDGIAGAPGEVLITW